MKKQYISQKLLEQIEAESVDATATDNNPEMYELFFLAQKIETAIQNEQFKEFHIELRNLGEYTRSIFGVNTLAGIVTSFLCNFTSDADNRNYTDVFMDLEDTNARYIKAFYEKSPENQENELQLIGAQSLFASNFLHKTVNRLELIIDEATVPPAYQTHLLISLCRQGILRRQEQRKANCAQSIVPRWERGFTHWNDPIEEQEKNIIDLFYAIINNQEFPESFIGIESAEFVYYILIGKLDTAIKKAEKMRANTSKADNINRYYQVRLLLVMLYYRGKRDNKTLEMAETLCKETCTEYPHIAQQTLYLLRYEQTFDRNYKSDYDWSSILSDMPDFPRPSDIIDLNIEKTVYVEINRKKTDSVSLGSSAEPILGQSVIDIFRNIVNACSYGMIMDIPSQLTKLLQYFLVQIDIKQSNTTIEHLIAFLPIVLRLQSSHNDTIKAACNLYTQYAKENDIEKLFDEIKNINSQAYYDLLYNFAPITSEKILRKNFGKVKELYQQEEVPKHYIWYTYRVTLFKLYLSFIRGMPKLLGDGVQLFLFSELKEIMKLCLPNDVLPPLEKIFLKIGEVADEQKKLEFRSFCLEMLEEDKREGTNCQYFWIYFAYFFGETSKELYNTLTPFTQLRLAIHPNSSAYGFLEPQNILDIFDAEIEQRLKTTGYSSSDFFISNFEVYCFQMLSYFKDNQDDLQIIIESILKMIRNPSRILDFTGDRPDHFWQKVYSLFSSDIPSEAKAILFHKTRDVIDKVKESKFRHLAMQKEIEIFLDFYQTVITCLVSEKNIDDEKYFSLVLSIDNIQQLSSIIHSYYDLYRNSTKTQKHFLSSYMINFITNAKHSPNNVYIMAVALSSLTKDDVHLQEKVAPFVELWAFRIQKLFLQ